MMRRSAFALLFIFSCLVSLAQTDAVSAVNITAEDYFNSPPTWANHCLIAASGQTSTTCSTAPTDVRWFKFTIPTTINTSSVKISVIPTGFDAVIDFFSGPAGAPVFEECMNAAGSGGAEYLKTTSGSPTFNPIVTGTTYFFRVSATTDVASGCFDLGLEYYPVAGILSSPNPSPDAGLPGYKVNNFISRNFPTAAGQVAQVQASRYRIVDTDLPPGSAGCTVEITGSFDQRFLRDFSCVCYNNSYNVFVELRVDNHWCGEGASKLLNMESEPTASISNAQCQVVTTSTNINVPFIANGASLQWEFTVAGQAPLVFTTAAGVNVLSVATVPCIIYNQIYSVRVRANYCNVYGSWSAPWCMITPPVPYLNITSPSSCPAVVFQYGTIQCNYIVGATNIWQFIPIDIDAPMIPIAPAIVYNSGINNTVYLPFVGLTYGTTYRVSVKPKFTCGGIVQEGDFGPWCIMSIGALIDNDMPILEEEWTSEEERNEFVYTTNESGKVNLFTYTGYDDQRIVTLNTEGTDLSGTGVVKIYNMAGQVVKESVVNLGEGQSIFQVNLNEPLATGVYIISAQFDGGMYSDKFFYE